MVILNCVLKGETVADAFVVEIENTCTIGQLRRMIKAERPDLAQLPAAHLRVYCMSVNDGDDGALERFCQMLDLGEGGVSPLTTTSILDNFPDPHPRQIHVLVVLPTVPTVSLVAPTASSGPLTQEFRLLHDELWNKESEFAGFEDFTVEVPQPEFYMEPGYRVRMEKAGIVDFPLLGVSPRAVEERFKKVQTSNQLPCRRSAFLIPPEYENVAKILEESDARKRDGATGEEPKWRKNADYIVSGQPGSGKTFFLSYLLILRLLKGLPTIYRMADEACYLFSDQGKGIKADVESLFSLSYDQKRVFWVLTDEALKNVQWKNSSSPWFIVLAASPKKIEASREWVKERSPRKHFMRNWRWEEIVAGYSLRHPVLEMAEIQLLYSTFICFGPVPRTCLETITVDSGEKEHGHVLSEYLGELDREIEHFAMSRGQILENVMSKNSSHKLALMQPTQEGRSYMACVSTRWVAHRMATVMGKSARQGFYETFENFCQVPELRTGAGWYFEGYAHNWLRYGGEFKIDELPARGPPVTEIVRTKRSGLARPNSNVFKKPKDLAQLIRRHPGSRDVDPGQIGIYYQPQSKTQESFDALVLNQEDEIVLFQHTMAQRHGIKSQGIDDLLLAMPAAVKTAWIVFVIPEDLAEAYSNAQNIPDPADLKWAGKIRQYRLVFTTEEIKEVVARGSHDLGVEGVVGGGGAHEGSSGGQRTQGVTSSGEITVAKTGGGNSGGEGSASGPSITEEWASGNRVQGETVTGEEIGGGNSGGEGRASGPSITEVRAGGKRVQGDIVTSAKTGGGNSGGEGRASGPSILEVRASGKRAQGETATGAETGREDSGGEGGASGPSITEERVGRKRTQGEAVTGAETGGGDSGGEGRASGQSTTMARAGRKRAREETVGEKTTRGESTARAKRARERSERRKAHGVQDDAKGGKGRKH